MSNKIVFPVSEASPMTSGLPPSDLQLQGLRILVVEDSADMQMLLQINLEKQGAHVEIASDGEEGVAKALAQSFDIVLMDIQMPRMNGFQAMALLKAEKFATPIIALTAHAMKEEVTKTQEAGFCGHLAKPIQRKDLIATILQYTS